MDLYGKAALITGGARMGAELAGQLASRGCDVAVTYRASRAGADAAVRRAAAAGRRGLAVRADLRREKDASRVVAAAAKAFGRLDVLVNMASVYEESPLARQTKDLRPWTSAAETDLRGAYLLSLRAAALMKKNGGGRIVNFTDWLPVSGRPRYKDYLPYYVAKGGVKALTEALALELAPEILVNAVAPGPALPPPGLSPRRNREVLKNTPLGRWGGAGEIAKAVLFFIESDFVTGECLRVDGGRHLY